MDYKQLLVQFTEGSTYIQAYLHVALDTPIALKVKSDNIRAIYIAHKKDNEHLPWKSRYPSTDYMVFFQKGDNDVTILMEK